MQILLCLAMFVFIKVQAQENAKPLFYNPGFTMPDSHFVRTDGFYMVRTTFCDTIPTSSLKQQFFIHSYETNVIYQFFSDGSFFHREFADRTYEKIVGKLKNDPKWVRNLPSLYGVSCWGFYKIEKGILAMEFFSKIYTNLLKGIKRNSFFRTEKAYPVSNGNISYVQEAINQRPRHSESCSIEFIESLNTVNNTGNDLLKDRKFKEKTGFDPGNYDKNN